MAVNDKGLHLTITENTIRAKTEWSPLSSSHGEHDEFIRLQVVVKWYILGARFAL
jgi:hypothetical protein